MLIRKSFLFLALSMAFYFQSFSGEVPQERVSGKPIYNKITRLANFNPTEIWPDADGNHIQAHGGGIIKIKKTYYWYGEQRGKGLDPKYRYVSCYSSKDLLNWKFRGNVVKMLPPDSISDKWVLERPKVFYNAGTKRYVMYFHLDDRGYKGFTKILAPNTTWTKK